MRHQTGRGDEGSNKGNGNSCEAEVEGDRDMNGVRKKNKMKDPEGYSFHEMGELQAEFDSLRRSLMQAKEELKVKDGKIESLKSEIQRTKDLEQKLAEKDASLEWLKEEIHILKASEASLEDGRIRDIVLELGKRKESEANMFDSLASQTKQLEETKILLEESRLEILFLQNKLAKMEGTKANGVSYDSKGPSLHHRNGSITSPSRKGELRASVSFTDKLDTRLSPSQTKSLLGEVDVLKTELAMATQAEEKSKKAMDDLAMALTEVATENKNMKEKLAVYRAELERTKEEAGRLRLTWKNTEEKYREVTEEAEKYKNTAERLQLEAEESNLAWNEKETEFVNCIKRSEEDIEELVEKLELCEKISKEENMKLRDILKQALNEANVAKEAAGIARAENSALQDSLTAKEQALELLTIQNEALKINEAAYLENINELKAILSVKTPPHESEEDDDGKGKASAKDSKESEAEEAIRLAVKEEASPENEADHAAGNESFHSPMSGFFPAVDLLPPEECEHVDEPHLDHCEDRNCKKKRALLRRVGDILKRRASQSHR